MLGGGKGQGARGKVPLHAVKRPVVPLSKIVASIHHSHCSSPILWRGWRHPDARRKKKNSRKNTGFRPKWSTAIDRRVCYLLAACPTQPRKLTKPNTRTQSRTPPSVECTPPSMEWCRRSSSVWLTSKSFQRMARIPMIATSSTIRQLTILHVLKLPDRSGRRGFGNTCRLAACRAAVLAC